MPYDEMDTEKLWLQHQAEFLPNKVPGREFFRPCYCILQCNIMEVEGFRVKIVISCSTQELSVALAIFRVPNTACQMLQIVTSN